VPAVRVNGTTLAYERFGTGPDIVFVAGGGDTGSRWHRYQVPHFTAAGFRCTTFDNRGVGGTIAPDPPWTASDLAGDVAGLIEALCEHPVALVGHSMGGIIAQQVAIERPDLVRCAVLIGTYPHAPSGWVRDYHEAEIAFRRTGGRLDGMIGLSHYAAMLFPASALDDPATWGRIREDLLAWMSSGDNERSLIAQWELCLRNDQRDQLRRCRVPLHVIAGSQDVEVPPSLQRSVAELAPEATFELVEGAGHGSLFGHLTERFNELIEERIRRHL
jgi:3-oxoadipate enol-lactonase